MKKSKTKKQLEDADYDHQIERLSGLAKFPHLPAAKGELRRAMRRISEMDLDFLRRLIDDVVDSAKVCPTPAELIEMAGAKRHRVHKAVGKPDCERCGGSGFVTTVRTVTPPGMEPYDTDFAEVCGCRTGK